MSFRRLLFLTLMACLPAESPAFVVPGSALCISRHASQGVLCNVRPALLGKPPGRPAFSGMCMMASFAPCRDGNQSGGTKWRKRDVRLSAGGIGGGAGSGKGMKGTWTMSKEDLNDRSYKPTSMDSVDNKSEAESLAAVPKVKEQKVKVFGAYLDHTVAGRDGLLAIDKDQVMKKVINEVLDENNNDIEKAREQVDDYIDRTIQADGFFRRGVQAMVRQQLSLQWLARMS